jgi:hypothetical protein
MLALGLKKEEDAKPKEEIFLTTSGMLFNQFNKFLNPLQILLDPL